MTSTSLSGPRSHLTSAAPDALPSEESSNQHHRNRRGGRNRWRGKGRGRGRGTHGTNATRDTEHDDGTPNAALPSKKYQPPRPTHFLALPLHNHPTLNAQMIAFHNALFLPSDINEPLFGTKAASNPSSSTSLASNAKKRLPPQASTLVEGLDTSIIIDPVRMHMTLGVMALELDEDMPKEGDAPFIRADVVAEEEPVSSIIGHEGNLLTSNTESRAEMGAESNMKERDHDWNLVASGDTSEKKDCESTALNYNPSSSIKGGRSGKSPFASSALTFTSDHALPPTRQPRKTVATALSLLSSLKPAISEILNGAKGVKVPLEVMDVLKTRLMPSSQSKEMAAVEEGEDGRGDKVGAGVLFLGPSESKHNSGDEERMKLEQVTALVHKTFKEHGYITENRPLKLHCSVLNASHRRPPRNRGQPFSYSDILALEPALWVLGADAFSSSPLRSHPGNTDNTTIIEASTACSRVSRFDPEEFVAPPLMDNIETATSEFSRKTRRAFVVPSPIPINLGTHQVDRIELWKMGSFGPHGEYVSCGGIELE